MTDTWFNRPMTADDIPAEIDPDAPEPEPRYEVYRLGDTEVVASGDDLGDMHDACQNAGRYDTPYGIWDTLTESYCAIAYQGVMFWE